jgi:hypothetical protein
MVSDKTRIFCFLFYTTCRFVSVFCFLFFLFFCMRCRHFRLHGVKMLCLQEVKRNKLLRDEADFAKDILDTVAIDRLLDA